VERDRAARCVRAGGVRRERAAARGPARGASERRGDAVLARRPDRGGAALGRAPPPGLLSSAPQPDELLSIAVDAAHEAGALLTERFAAGATALRAKSTPTDLVSEADLAAERLIRERLAAARPGDAILGEEGGDRAPSAPESGLRWIVDPLDGTVNFLFGIPQWSVSIACEQEGETLAAVVHDALRRETFTAAHGGRAALNGRPIRGSERAELATAMVATGFSYEASTRALQAQTVAHVLPRVRDIRRFGSAAIDLAWTACGRFDAYYERGLQQWDLAAGAYICRCAGLEVRELTATEQPAGLLVAPSGLVEGLQALVDH
jgi:myo-inositol-1(or 4)-monophosphatase